MHVVLSTEDRNEVDGAKGEGDVGPGGLGPLVPVIDVVVLLGWVVRKGGEGGGVEGFEFTFSNSE